MALLLQINLLYLISNVKDDNKKKTALFSFELNKSESNLSNKVTINHKSLLVDYEEAIWGGDGTTQVLIIFQ